MKYLLPILLLSAAVLGLTLKGVAGNPEVGQVKGNLDQASKPLELSPERGRFLLTMNLHQNHRFDLSQEYADAVYPDVGWVDGRFYIYFAPGMSVMALPFYELGLKYGFSQLFSFAMTALFALGSVVALYYIARKILGLPGWAAAFVPMVFLFGSMALGYATTMYQHHLTAFLLYTAFIAAWQFERSRYSWPWAIYVGLAYGASIFIDLPNVLLLLPAALYLVYAAIQIRNDKDRFTVRFFASSVLAFIVFMAFIGLLGYYNQQEHGSWARLSHSLTGYKQIVESGGLEASQLAAVDKGSGSKYFSEHRFAEGVSVLLFSKDRGLFYYFPVFLVALVGAFAAIRSGRLEAKFLAAAAALHVVMYASWGDPWGGWAFGARYMIPAAGLLALLVGVALQRFPQWWSRVPAVLLFAPSVAVAMLGALTTNAVPPKVEATYFGNPWGYEYNYVFLANNHSSSFVYNTYFKGDITLLQYGIIISGAIVLLAFFLVVIVPIFTQRHADID